MYNKDDPEYRGNEKPVLVYSSTISTYQAISIAKIMLFYAFELIFWLVVSKIYLNFGAKWITPAVSAMWIMGALTAYFIPEERENTIKETKWAILGFLAFLFLYKCVIGIIASISSEHMGAALNITIPAASGMAAAGFLQNILWIVSVLTPIGFLVWCGQKFRVYHGRSTKQEAFRRIKGTFQNIKRF